MNTLPLECRSATCVLVFIASTWLTIIWCGSVCDMPGMGTWFRAAGQSRLEHFLVFQGMWSVMMIAMMMPVFAPALLRAAPAAPMPVAVGYFAAWTSAGVAIYPLGMLLGSQPWSAAAGGVLVVSAGLLQFGAGKMRLLHCCRVIAGEGWRRGFRAGIDCIGCCAGLTATLLVVGVMDLRAMALVTLAIAAERLLPARTRAAEVIGVLLVGIGVVLCARALGPG